MATILGPLTILNKALPTGLDGARLAQWELRSGGTFGQFVQRTAVALGEFNQRMINRWGWLIYLTEEPYFEYGTGGSVSPSPLITDLDNVDATHGETIAHMIDLLPYGEKLGGTNYSFRDAREATLRAAIRDKMNRLEWRFEQLLLNRWFVPTDTAVGSVGYNVPFVHSTTGAVDFTPPAYGGEAFASTHDHYIGCDSNSKGYDEVLNELAEHLEEHGHPEPFTAVVARANVSSYYALPDFERFIPDATTMIDRGTTTADTGANFFRRGPREFGIIGGYHSQYGYVEVRATTRVPTTFAGMVKSYGNNVENNPLAVRVHPLVGFGARIVAQSREDDVNPVKELRIDFELGVGVGQDRTNGAAAKLVAGGAWGDPSIS